jgi:phage portal protein BeeE
MWDSPLSSLSRNPNRLMLEAQSLYYQPWVHVAEQAVVNRMIRLPWHLEDEEGETFDGESNPEQRALLNLIERPNKRQTRRQLWGITLRHMGLCGNAFWYLDQRDLLAGTPLEIMYINPARMTPALDSGKNVVGWVLDGPDNPVTGSDGNPGVPLDVEEVIHFRLDEPDFGVWGIGIAQAAQRKVELSRITDGYIGQVLGTGGRITGIIAPKDDRTQFTDDEFMALGNEWRRIVEDPQAAKRLQIMKKPIELVQTSMSPRDLLLPDVAKMSRDDTLAMWGVPLSSVGIPTPAGLNSGEKGKYDEAAMYEGAVQPRGESFREKVQYEFLDRFAGLGLSAQLVIEFPTFDDLAPLYDNADKAKIIPRRIDEARESVGLDPLDPAIYGKLGEQIIIDQSIVFLKEDEPEPEPLPAVPAPVVDEPSPTDEEDVVAKADIRKPLLGLRHKMEVQWEPRIRQAVQDVLTEQRRFISSKLPHISAKPSDTTWWNEKREQRRFMVALDPLIEELTAEVAGGTARLAQKPRKADTSIYDYVRAKVGERITGINNTTREKVQKLVAEGIEQGMSPQDLGSALKESAAFDAARADMIARTETAYAYNDSAIQSYLSLDVEQVQVIDGDKDAECAHADGATWSMDEALSNPISHPNCTRDFIPVVKAVVEPNPMLIMAEAYKASLDRPPAIINVTTPDVHVTTPPVHVTTPAVNVHVPKPHLQADIHVPQQPPPTVNVSTPEAKAQATLPTEIRIVSMPDRVKVAQRNAEGEIVRMAETDIDG